MASIQTTRALALEAPVDLPDGAGGLIRSWQVLGTLWAEVLPGTGRAAAGEEVSLGYTPFRITVRGAPPGSDERPQAGQRFREGGRLFTILAVTERDAAGGWLTCFAKEESPA